MMQSASIDLMSQLPLPPAGAVLTRQTSDSSEADERLLIRKYAVQHTVQHAVQQSPATAATAMNSSVDNISNNNNTGNMSMDNSTGNSNSNADAVFSLFPSQPAPVGRDSSEKDEMLLARKAASRLSTVPL